MQKYNFNKLLSARYKAHEKRILFIEKGDLHKSKKLENKINNLSDIITDVINKM